MSNIIEVTKDLIRRASELHLRERQLTLESVEICGRLYHFRAHVAVCLKMDDFARRIGLTPDVYAKRAKASRLMSRFPRVRQMVETGALAITSVAALYPKITEANETMLLDAVAHQPKREVERLVARITHTGEWIPGEAEIELKLTLKESDLKKIDRAREVLSHGDKVPVTAEVLMKAIEDLLERRDPLRRAQRAVARKAGSTSTFVARDGSADEAVPNETPRIDDKGVASRPGAARPAIPAHLRHQIMLRDEARCTWVNPDGTRCPERMMVEFDHLVPWREGGRHSLENLTLRCRCHNQHRAEMEMGRPLREFG